jgi:hypothetical protein
MYVITGTTSATSRKYFPDAVLRSMVEALTETREESRFYTLEG